MANLKQLKTDPSLREEGVEFHFALDVYLRIRPMPNPEFSAYVRKQSKGFRRGNVDPDVAEGLSIDGVARHVLVGWTGLEDDDGELLECTLENRLKILKDPDLRELTDFIVTVASDLSNFRAEELEADAKN